MAQLALNKGKTAMVRTEVVKISGSMLSQRIQQFSLTLIGRLMNPSIQRMDSLVANMPKIWKMEEKVVGADLGKGIFQFNFQSEEDMQGVLQNVPYHFDGWMVSLVKGEPIISATYPSAINFWVKVSDLPMHLWEEATLKAIGKKVGIIRELDVDSGSIYVTVNGFNPLVFQMVVPFDTGDEVVVSLDYEKLAKYCHHCSRMTHDVAVCPELNKKAGNRLFEEYGDRRGGSRQQIMVKQMPQGNEGGWEKPRKPAAKRALEFSGEEPSGGFHYQLERGDNSRQSHRRGWEEVAMEGLMDSHYSVQGTEFTKKGAGPVWPKPLYQPKAISKVSQASHKVENVSKIPDLGEEKKDSVMEDVPEVQDKSLTVGINFSESTDDLLEDGEYHAEEDIEVQVMAEKTTEDEGNETHEENMNALQGNVQISNVLSDDIGLVRKGLKGITLDSKKIQNFKGTSSQGIRGINGNRDYSRIVASPGKRLLAKAMSLKSADDGIKQKVADKNKVKEVTKAGRANRNLKKGMVDLPKPPAHT
ncbi:unnamed protein product [Arabidopsis arenosa]|uniref:DUF4283 domain-containing protein n=1 Tax=Arabidopsis arenosa TaxID=38785 RepID=A0A8S2B122_ARAAE|nr:unnamed protein product [Arabidopsis arenosa]